MEDHTHRRHDDPEYIEDHFVRVTFCDERDRAMKNRMDKMELSVDRLVEQTNKSNTKLAVILGILMFIGTAAGILAQYIAIIPIIRGAHP